MYSVHFVHVHVHVHPVESHYNFIPVEARNNYTSKMYCISRRITYVHIPVE